MAEFPALNLWTDAWLADTAHLPRADRDIYLHLLVLMWRTPGCRVPNEIDWISRKLRCVSDEALILKSVISEFCQCDGNWITQKRLTKEFKLASERSRAASVKAKSRWNKEKAACSGNATTTTTIITEKSSPLTPQRGEGNAEGARYGRRKQGYQLRESFHQAVERIKARGNAGSDEGSADDPVLLPGFREGSA